MTHNINAATGTYQQRGDDVEVERTGCEYAQVYDSALLAAMEKTKGTRVPKIPRRDKHTRVDEKKARIPKGVSWQVTKNENESTEPILPKAYEDQRQNVAKKTKSGGWGGNKVSIVITKPKLTINGFRVEED